jgi:hypothetical protein
MRWAEALAVAFYVCVAMFTLYYGAKLYSQEPRLPCGVAEISPDFSNAQREECRKIRGHKL